MEGNKNRFIIIDHGTNFIRAGFSDEAVPIVNFPSIIGTKRKTMTRGPVMQMPGMMKPNTIQDNANLFGHDAIAQSSVLRIDTTLDDRIFLKQSAESLYVKILKDLKIYDDKTKTINEDNQLPVVYLVSSFVDKIFLEHVCSIFIDAFKLKICIVPQALAVVNTHSNGLIIDIGDAATDFASVLSSKVVKCFSKQIQLGGRHLTNFLKECYDDHEFFKYASILKINELKAKHALVSLDFNKEFSSGNLPKVNYEVEDSEYEFSKELLKAGEILFNPKLNDIEESGLNVVVEGLVKMLPAKDLDEEDNVKKNQIFNKIFLVGGGSKVKSLDKRLRLELEKIIPNFELIFDEQNADLASWNGAKKLVENSEFVMKWMNINGAEDYNYDSFYSYLKY